MLRNEKYAGDSLQQKTFVADGVEKRSVKNNGELPQYYVSNNHPAIIDRAVFTKVQEEITRRAALTKAPSRTSKTPQSKYSGKFALNGVLVCAECGSPYRRVTWTQNGAGESRLTHRAVWRCVSRLEHGKKLCRNSPTLDEAELHAAITDALSEVIERETLSSVLMNSVHAAQNSDAQTSEYLSAKRRLAELDERFDALLGLPNDGHSEDGYLKAKAKALMDARSAALALIAEYEANNSSAEQSLSTLGEPLTITQYSENLLRQLIDTIRVGSGGEIQITLKGGEQIRRKISTNRREAQCESQTFATSQSMN
jgi:tellurite resistance protein